jgi:phosphoglycolate phosphatase-like HAD superfamily hydrolase
VIERNGALKPVVALDLDGTLGDYHGHFLKFAEGWFGQKFPGPQTMNPGYKLWEFMNVPLGDYRRCKLAYRQGGMKRTMPIYAGASKLSAALRVKGAEVWICTSRPFERLDNIDPDTRECLDRNGIQYDHILYGPEKYRELAEQVGRERVVAVADDLPEMIEAAADANLWRRYLRDQPYNRHLPYGWKNAERVHHLEALKAAILLDLEGWENRVGRK